MTKYAATYGLILGVFSILISVIDYAFGFYGQNTLIKVSGVVVTICAIVYFTVKYRNEQCEGYLSYGQSVGFGILLCLFAAVVSAVFTLLLITVIEPEYMTKVHEIAEQQLIEKGISGQQLDTVMEFTRKFSGPGMIVISSILSALFFGLIICLITSIFTKREKPVF